MDRPNVKANRIIGSAPQFFVTDLARSLDFYCDVLGFERPRLWGDPPFFAMPQRDGHIVMLNQNDAAPRNNGGQWDAYFWVDDAGALSEEFAAKGAVFLYGPELKDYGCFEFALHDPDGYVLAFAHEVGES